MLMQGLVPESRHKLSAQMVFDPPVAEGFAASMRKPDTHATAFPIAPAPAPERDPNADCRPFHSARRRFLVTPALPVAAQGGGPAGGRPAARRHPAGLRHHLRARAGGPGDRQRRRRRAGLRAQPAPGRGALRPLHRRTGVVVGTGSVSKPDDYYIASVYVPTVLATAGGARTAVCHVKIMIRLVSHAWQSSTACFAQSRSMLREDRDQHWRSTAALAQPTQLRCFGWAGNMYEARDCVTWFPSPVLLCMA